MRVLVACEESQAVCKAFRELGHEAYSCDILLCSGGHPEWHIHGDVLELLETGKGYLEDGHIIYIKDLDLMIAHPPCTYLSFAGIRWFNIERYKERAINRYVESYKALVFIMKLWNANIPKIVIENPRGFLMKLMKPNQIINPYQFGDKFTKPTCLWIKGLPNLKPSNIVEKGEFCIHTNKHGKIKRDSKWYYLSVSLPKEERAKFRSKTFQGIAHAMATQWGRTK